MQFSYDFNDFYMNIQCKEWDILLHYRLKVNEIIHFYVIIGSLSL